MISYFLLLDVSCFVCGVFIMGRAFWREGAGREVTGYLSLYN